MAPHRRRHGASFDGDANWGMFDAAWDITSLLLGPIKTRRVVKPTSAPSATARRQAAATVLPGQGSDSRSNGLVGPSPQSLASTGSVQSPSAMSGGSAAPTTGELPGRHSPTAASSSAGSQGSPHPGSSPAASTAHTTVDESLADLSHRLRASHPPRVYQALVSLFQLLEGAKRDVYQRAGRADLGFVSRLIELAQPPRGADADQIELAVGASRVLSYLGNGHCSSPDTVRAVVEAPTLQLMLHHLAHTNDHMRAQAVAGIIAITGGSSAGREAFWSSAAAAGVQPLPQIVRFIMNVPSVTIEQLCQSLLAVIQVLVGELQGAHSWSEELKEVLPILRLGMRHCPSHQRLMELVLGVSRVIFTGSAFEDRMEAIAALLEADLDNHFVPCILEAIGSEDSPSHMHRDALVLLEALVTSGKLSVSSLVENGNLLPILGNSLKRVLRPERPEDVLPADLQVTMASPAFTVVSFVMEQAEVYVQAGIDAGVVEVVCNSFDSPLLPVRFFASVVVSVACCHTASDEQIGVFMQHKALQGLCTSLKNDLDSVMRARAALDGIRACLAAGARLAMSGTVVSPPTRDRASAVAQPGLLSQASSGGNAAAFHEESEFTVQVDLATRQLLEEFVEGRGLSSDALEDERGAEQWPEVRKTAASVLDLLKSADPRSTEATML